ncbi:MAG: hypothetical protein AAFV53_12965 [Myxococcota bacterium]
MFGPALMMLLSTVAFAGVEMAAGAGIAQDGRGGTFPAALASTRIQVGHVQARVWTGAMDVDAGSLQLGLRARQDRFEVAGGAGVAGVLAIRGRQAGIATGAAGAWLELDAPVFFLWRTFDTAIFTARLNVFSGGPGTFGMGGRGNRAAMLNAHARLYARLSPEVRLVLGSDTVSVHYLRDVRAHAVSLGIRYDWAPSTMR